MDLLRFLQRSSLGMSTAVRINSGVVTSSGSTLSGQTKRSSSCAPWIPRIIPEISHRDVKGGASGNHGTGLDNNGLRESSLPQALLAGGTPSQFRDNPPSVGGVDLMRRSLYVLFGFVLSWLLQHPQIADKGIRVRGQRCSSEFCR